MAKKNHWVKDVDINSPMDLYNRMLLLIRLVYINFPKMAKIVGRSQASFERYKTTFPSELVLYNIQRTTGFSALFILHGHGYPLANNQAGFRARNQAQQLGTLEELESLTNVGPPFDTKDPTFDKSTDTYDYKTYGKSQKKLDTKPYDFLLNRNSFKPNDLLTTKHKKQSYDGFNMLTSTAELVHIPTKYNRQYSQQVEKPRMSFSQEEAEDQMKKFWLLDSKTPLKIDEAIVSEILSIPMYDVNAKANIGSLSSFDDLPISTVKLAVGLRLNPEHTVGLKVRGNSMQDAGILDGSIVLIDKSKQPNNGSGIACLLNGVLLVKIFEKNSKGSIELVSRSEGVQPIPVSENDTFEFIGVIRAVLSHWS